MGGGRLTVRAHHDEHRVRPGAVAFAWRSPSSSCSPAASPKAHKTKVHSNRLAVAVAHLSFRRGGRWGRLTHRPGHGKQPTATGMEPAPLQSGAPPRISHDPDNFPGKPNCHDTLAADVGHDSCKRAADSAVMQDTHTDFKILEN